MTSNSRWHSRLVLAGFFLLGFLGPATTSSSRALHAEPELVRAFIFGSRDLSCELHNAPGQFYTAVVQTSPANLEYNSGRGWGYEVVDPDDTTRAGYGIFGPFDDSANDRNAFGDSCPEEIYDSFIGAKTFASPCSSEPAPATGECAPPEGIIFRIDLPPGVYRFVSAVGSADNLHAHRLTVEDGGAGGPASLGANHVVLVDNFDQAEHGQGVFARVGFDGLVPPPAAVNGFVDFGENGLVAASASSPTLDVTSGHIRVHQLKGKTSGTDANGGDLVIFEVWRVEDSFRAIEPGSTWRYFRGQSEASSPVPAWRALNFDDASWAAGAAPFGYGEAGIATDLSDLSPPMQSNYTTLFLRQTFEVSNITAVSELLARANYDDGFVMWINEIEVLRVNANGTEGDPVLYDDRAAGTHESGSIEEFQLPNPLDYLVNGTNIVCVEVLNATISSTDLFFDIEIVDPIAPDLVPPSVSSLVPFAGGTFRSLSQIEVTFDEDVTGVDAGDLLVDGAPASSVVGEGRGPYVFSFSPAAPGVVTVEWSSGHGIVDLGDFSNPFAGGSWTYTIDPDAPLGTVAINEILAVNRSGLRDFENEEGDWFELVNDGDASVSLAGWSVTDDPNEPGLWVLPNIVLAPGEHVVVFATGKDLTGGEPHTSFRLSAEGEYFGLFNAESPRQVISEIAPRFPPQQPDISYGRNGAGELVYFTAPTPGAPNSGGVTYDGYVLEPVAAPGRGFYDAPFDVFLSSGTPGAQIRYTLDGSPPSATSGTLYTGPFQISGSASRAVVTLRAIAYRSGFLPSRVSTYSYIFVDHVLTQPRNPSGFPSTWNSQTADYEMDPDVVNDPGHRNLILEGLTSIPTLSVVADVDDLFSSSTGIYANPSRDGPSWERPVSAEFIYPSGRASHQANCGMRIQGGSSVNNWKVIKVSMRLLFKGEYGPTKLRHRLFPDSTVDEFDTIVLDAHMNQTWQHPNHGQRVRGQYCRDQYVSDLQKAAGGLAPHDIFFHLYLNGLYWGVFDLHERADASFAASHYGGDKTQYDALRHSGSNVVDGSSSSWSTMMNFVRRDLSNTSNYLDLENHLDIRSFANYMLVNFFCGNDDWPHHNWYATKFRQPGFGFQFHSWDAEHTLKSVSIDRTSESRSGTPGEIYDRLRASPEFRLLFADEAHRHFFNGGILYVDEDDPAWDPAQPERNRPAAHWMRRIDEVDPAIACEAARWGDTRRPSEPYTRNDEWMAELNWLLTQYFPNRSGNVLGQLRSRGLYPNLGAPILSQHGGEVDPGFVLSMSLPAGTNGTIYFTTDGTDPRVFGSGAVSGRSESYEDPIILTDHAHVLARTRSGTTWSALAEATFSFADPREVLRVTEIMFNPVGGNGFEFLELKNTGTRTIDLAGARFSGIDFTFDSSATLAPGAFVVLVSDPASFASRYPGVDVDGEYFGQLANGGEEIQLRNAAGELIFDVDYDDGQLWPIGADGFGYSLVRIDETGDPDSPSSWGASRNVDGSPGSDDLGPAEGAVVVSEILANAADPLEGAIELFNRDPAAVDLGGWFLSDARTDAASLRKYRIPDGTILPSGESIVFYAIDFEPAGLSLEPAGGSVFLASADGGGALTGHIAEGRYEAGETGVSFGRFATSEDIDFGALSARTFGADSPASVEEFRTGTGEPNAEPRFGPLVINEIMYNPGGDREEFIEIFNPTGAPVSLYDDALGVGWNLRGVLNSTESGFFEFSAGDVVPSGGYLLVVGIDPAAFRSLHAVPGSVPIVGAFGGGVSDGGERLRLERPLFFANFGVVPTVVDEVRYNDKDPWPTEADGAGPSLERIVATSYGSDPVNWAASTRDGGTPGIANTAVSGGGNLLPGAVIAASPSSGDAPLEVFFDGTQSYDLDGEIVSYLWDFDDGAMSTSASIGHTFAAPGNYVVTLVVTDDDGAEDVASQFIFVGEDLGGGQIPGDANQDGRLDIADGVKILVELFVNPGGLPCDGPIDSAANAKVFDVNADAGVNVADALYVLNYLFADGPPPSLGTGCVPVLGCPDVCAF